MKPLPVTVVALVPLTKFGMLAAAPIGAKLTVAVIAGAEAETVPPDATSQAGTV